MTECKKTVCFSGHRPEKLPGQGIESDTRTQIIKSMLYFKIHTAVNDGYRCFITGLSRGIDLWASEIVLEFKKKYDDIELICAKPIPSFGLNYFGDDRYMYRHAIENASAVVTLCETYNKNCYMLRNRYMVDNSSLLIAVISDYRSGTGQTVNYARKQGIRIELIAADEINSTYELHYNTEE